MRRFRRGEASEYEGPRDARGIVAHLKEQLNITRTMGKALRLADINALNELMAAGPAVVGYFREPMYAPDEPRVWESHDFTAAPHTQFGIGDLSRISRLRHRAAVL